MTVTVKQMADHLRIASAMEGELYAYQQLYNKLKRRINTLESTQYYTDNDYLEDTFKIDADTHRKKHLKKGTKIWIVLCILACPIALIAISSSISSTEMLQQMGLWLLSFGSWFVIITVVLILKRKKANADKKDKTKSIDNRLQNSKKLQQKNELILKDYNVQLSAVVSSYNKVRNDLNNVYSENILPGKYRNFAATTTMYQWLTLGICLEIYGHGGLYDRYENFLMQNRIISNLEDINSKLDIVIENQRNLYDEIQKANSIAEKTYQSVCSIEKNTNRIATNTDNMAKDMQQIRTNTSITAMNTTHQARLQEYMAYRSRYYY